MTQAAEVLRKYLNASRSFEDPQNILPEPISSPFRRSKHSSNKHSSSSSSKKQSGLVPIRQSLSLCNARPRRAVQNFTGIQQNAPWVITYWADLTPNTTCKWTPSHLLLSGCTGNQLAPHLVLTAAHCVDVELKRSDADDSCQLLSLVRVVLCYGFDRKPGASRECGSAGVEALGVSWNSYLETGSPHDQAIVFTASTRPGPYFQYQYQENLADLANSSSSTFESLAYSGDGTPAGKKHPRCGCQACPSVPCGLAQTGPAAGPLRTDPKHPRNGAVSAGLESCGGSSGSCMTVNGQTCCIAVDSYSRSSGADPCTSLCASYWSSISAAKPLSALWSKVHYPLPR